MVTRTIDRYKDGLYGINPETGVEEELGQNTLHFAELIYLLSVLEFYYKVHKKQEVGIVQDIPLHTGNKKKTVSPDITVIDGFRVDEENPDFVKTYEVGVDGPPPRLVIEIASETTWDLDLDVDEKRGRYAKMGIPLYIAFDPYTPTIWENEWANKGRLVVWQLNRATGQYEELSKDNGRVWCQELESWLVIEGHVLRLYDKNNKVRPKLAQGLAALAEEQAAVAQAEAELAKERVRQLTTEKQQTEAENLRITSEKQQTEAENLRITSEKQQTEAENLRLQEEIERLRAQLRGDKTEG
jgi:Uma2 family endonuclease